MRTTLLFGYLDLLSTHLSVNSREFLWYVIRFHVVRLHCLVVFVVLIVLVVMVLLDISVSCMEFDIARIPVQLAHTCHSLLRVAFYHYLIILELLRPISEHFQTFRV